MKEKVDVSLSGCSTLFNCHFGAMSRLTETYNIDKIASTSGGSIIGSLYALGFSNYKINKILNEVKFNEVLDRNFIPFLNDGFGLYQGNIIESILKKYMNISFKEAYSKTGIELNIFVTELGNLNPIIYNHISTPNELIYKAIRKSISIPLLFNKVSESDKDYVDGGILDNFPTDFLNDGKHIGIRIKSNLDKFKKPTNLVEYLISILDMIMAKLEFKIIEDSNVKICYVNSNFNPLSFNHSDKDIKQMFDEGYSQMDSFLKSI